MNSGFAIWNRRTDERQRIWYECAPIDGELLGYELWIHFDEATGVCRFGFAAPNGYRAPNQIVWTTQVGEVQIQLWIEACTHRRSIP